MGILFLQEYLIDAPVSMGDGFSFSGGEFSLQQDYLPLQDLRVYLHECY